MSDKRESGKLDKRDHEKENKLGNLVRNVGGVAITVFGAISAVCLGKWLKNSKN